MIIHKLLSDPQGSKVKMENEREEESFSRTAFHGNYRTDAEWTEELMAHAESLQVIYIDENNIEAQINPR